MNYETQIRDALASHTDDFAVGTQLHAVPPHVTHEVEFAGRRAVCKLATGPEADPETEARAVQHVHCVTDLPVPEVLAVGEDHFVAGWLDGLPGEIDLTESKVRAMGRGLAELHTVTAGDFDGSGLLRANAGELAVADSGTWSDTLLAVLADRKRFLEPYGYDDLVADVSDFVRANRESFDRVGETVLVHGNWLPEHVAVHDGETSAVVDFEHALVGSPEWDYLRAATPMFSGGEVEARGVRESVFREAYESVRSLQAGFDDRWRAYGVVNGVSYLKALHLQREPLDDLDEVRRRGARLAKHVRGELDALGTNCK